MIFLSNNNIRAENTEEKILFAFIPILSVKLSFIVLRIWCGKNLVNHELIKLIKDLNHVLTGYILR